MTNKPVNSRSDKHKSIDENKLFKTLTSNFQRNKKKESATLRYPKSAKGL